MFDIILENGRIVNGCGNPWFVSDIGIKNGKISKIGSLSGVSAETTINISNLTISPGFIDIHDHSDIGILKYPKAEKKVKQGVTSLLVGNCGISAAPLTEISKEILEKQQGTLTFPEIEVTWRSFEDYLNTIKKNKTAINIGSLVGQTTIREGILGLERRSPTEGELEQMKELTVQAMKEGAFGLSTGLIYSPGHYAKTREIIELSKKVAEYGGFYATHIRGHGTKDIEGLKEAIKIGEEVGISTQISHIETHLPDSWGKETEMLKILEEARKRDLDVTCDILPHMGTTGENVLKLYFQHFQELPGGVHEFLKKIRDPNYRDKIKEIDSESRSRLSSLVVSAPENIYIFQKEGKSIKKLAEEANREPFDYLMDLILESLKTGKNYAGVVILHNEEDIRIAIKHPLSMITADGSIEGKEPRDYANYPLAFRKYVRGKNREEMPEEVGKKIITMEEFVRKSTSFPAQRIGIKDRGLIEEGFWADLVVFDQDNLSDLGSYKDPHYFPEGIKHVFVNGVQVVENGEHTGSLPGKILLRPT